MDQSGGAWEIYEMTVFEQAQMCYQSILKKCAMFLINRTRFRVVYLWLFSLKVLGTDDEDLELGLATNQKCTSKVSKVTLTSK